MRIRNMTTRFTSATAATIFVAVAFTAVTLAQSEPADPPPSDETTDELNEQIEATSDQESLPSLDELLGIEPEDAAGPDAALDPALDPDRAELDRALSGEQAADMFVQAVQQMADAADLLELANSPGVQTQRLQDEIIRKLDILIEQAKQQQSSSSSSSSSGGDPSQQQQGQQPNQPQPGKQQQGQQDQSNEGDNREEGTPPERQDALLADRLDELHAAWGALPARIREALLQGSGDQFSSFYQSMTESYYRKLAGDRENRERNR